MSRSKGRRGERKSEECTWRRGKTHVRRTRRTRGEREGEEDQGEEIGERESEKDQGEKRRDRG